MISVTRPGSLIGVRLQRLVGDLATDCRGIAATEFAFIVPLMLVMFFGTVEFCSGIAVQRKVTLMARTLSDLTSQSTSVNDFTNTFAASNGIMYPYPTSPLNSTITELYVDPKTMQARVQWSVGSAPHAQSSTVGIPAALLVAGTYLIFSEVNYKYVPTVGYVMAQTGVTLGDVSYTRPRQSSCVFYTPVDGTTTTCPSR
ncbi:MULTISPECIES: TadE/TadG family type IV pilus assembly protein [unclassified Bradyrhizobium]|uniref:TadE/TadG family type IV pilus assembly protein n=1 Tax=unclassified Bradyrhizobium TaxID=2631580 RepID=UPI0028EF50AC|nr:MULTISPECIES: TadE/TadG family type IV pilus assembly protein [unclassified Bradyrhizobium]